MGNIAAFQKLETSQDRIAFINNAFSEIDLATYDALLPILIEKKDLKTELFWHYRRHIPWENFEISDEEREKNLVAMQQKAQKHGDKVAEIVAAIHLNLLKYKQKKLSTVELYYANLSHFEAMKSIGFEQFLVYDLNMMLLEMGKDLASYWQPEKGLDFLLLAEKYVQPSPISRYYHSMVLDNIRNCYYHLKDSANANAYSRKLYDTHYQLNPTEDPKLWRDLAWQAKAILQIATLYLANGQNEPCKVLTVKAIRLYKNQFDVETATKEQLMMEWDILEELTNIQISLGRVQETAVLLARMETIQKALHFEQSDDFMKLWGLYRDYEKYYLAQNDYKSAYPYKLRMDNMYIQLYDRNSQNQLEEMKQVHQVEKYNGQIKMIEKEKNRQQNLSITAVIFAIVASLLGYFVYRKIKKDKDVIALQKAQLEQSLGEKETLLKEIHHRVKNNLQIISGLLEKQAMKTKDEQAKKLMKEGQNRVFSMALVHQNLYQSENLSAIEIKSYLEVLTQNIQKSQIAKDQEIALVLDIDDSKVDIDTAIPLGLILNELITNCYKYAFQGREKGKIEIAFHQKDKKFDLSIADDGVGMANHFDIKKARSLGLNLVNGLVRQLDATLKMQTGENGTLFQISFAG